MRQRTDNPCRHITLSVTDKVLRGIDANINKLQTFMVSKGASEKDAQKYITRSGIMREVCAILAKPEGFNLIASAFSLALNIDPDQEDLFKQGET